MALTVLMAAWLGTATQAQEAIVPKPVQPAVRGRVLDEMGQPVAGARVRLYRRESRWERHNQVIEEATAGPDGGFSLSTLLTPRPMSESRGLPPYVLVADHAGKAVGWRTIPINASAFEGNITLTSPTERTITVVDADRHPMQGAKVVVYGVGDPASARPEFRDFLELRPDDGPLTAISGADGRATFAQMPKTKASFVATKPGFGETFAFDGQAVIRLTPAATLSGTVTDPGGEPLAGVKMVLYTGFMWDFEHAVTDAQGRYRFNDLRARGWDMSAWTPDKEADGKYKMWLDDDRFAMPTESLTLEPNTEYTFDIKAVKAGVIRVQVLEEGTNKPVAGVRIWGFDSETGSSSRFNAYTDAQGRATFHAAPARISLSLVGPPDGVYVEGDFLNNPEAHRTIDFAGGDDELTLVMPPIAGTLINVNGVCTLPDGSPAGDASVNAGAGRFVTSGTTSLVRERRTDGAGRFTLEGVPSGRTLCLYAETADRKVAGTVTITAPAKADPAFQITVRLAPTVGVEWAIEDDAGNRLRSKKFRLSPMVGKEDFPFIRRTVESDEAGHIKFYGIVPGLSYRVVEEMPPRQGPAFVRAGGGQAWYDKVLVLAPVEQR